MKKITESQRPQKWPRMAVKSVESRERDLLIRIADWTDDKDSPAYDVEVYIGGIYDWNESDCFEEKSKAIEFAEKQIRKLL